MAKKSVARKQPGRISKFWGETVGELRKVSWPTPREARRLTLIVIVVIIAMMIFLGGLDYLFSKLFELIFS